MKYDGIETTALLKQSADRMLYVCIAGGVLEGVGYLLYVNFYNSFVSLLTAIVFFSVNVLCFVFIYGMYFPKRLREQYKREDVPEEKVSWAWYERAEIYLIIPMVVFPNMNFIFLLTSRF